MACILRPTTVVRVSPSKSLLARQRTASSNHLWYTLHCLHHIATPLPANIFVQSIVPIVHHLCRRRAVRTTKWAPAACTLTQSTQSTPTSELLQVSDARLCALLASRLVRFPSMPITHKLQHRFSLFLLFCTCRRSWWVCVGDFFFVEGCWLIGLRFVFGAWGRGLGVFKLAPKS